MKTQIRTEPVHTITITVSEAERKMIIDFLNGFTSPTQNMLVVITGLKEAFTLPPEEERAS